MKMDDMTGPQMWHQTILIATWWLAAVQVIKPVSSMLMSWTWAKAKSQKNHYVIFLKDGFNYFR